MNLYTCQIDLKQEAKALAFSQAVQSWMEHLKASGKINDWRLLRRKLNLASGASRDFLLEIEVDNLEQLDPAFRMSGSTDEDVSSLYHAVHALIGEADFSLYRPSPDPERSERMGLL